MIFFIALSLSMDAFSLSLAYGSSYLKKKDLYLIPTIVGLFHFFMPIIGSFIGTSILQIVKISPSILVGIILLFAVSGCRSRSQELDLAICGSYAVPGMFCWDLKGGTFDVEVLETDEEGRILFSYSAENIITHQIDTALVVCKKID